MEVVEAQGEPYWADAGEDFVESEWEAKEDDEEDDGEEDED